MKMGKKTVEMTVKMDLQKKNASRSVTTIRDSMVVRGIAVEMVFALHTVEILWEGAGTNGTDGNVITEVGYQLFFTYFEEKVAMLKFTIC